MRNIAIFIVIVITGGTLLSIIALVLTRPTRPVYDQPDALVQVYLNALEQNDRQQIETLLAPKYHFQRELEQTLQTYGGLPLEHVRLSYGQTESPFFVTAELCADRTDANGNTVVVHNTLHLQKQPIEDPLSLFFGPRYSWFLVMGETTELPITDPPARGRFSG
ncbi:MAG: hypothetical protein GFH27_549297n325 [Chloroflexi bacterium AL-W]|nr:hypothetical protein [Chloroflexi bacterium AL-N1]NOK68822.1 hypothetical protein [Chloroflexi bacterium AL-N10]NOK76806.1 hypothetical protein [Chloroflexi bacterium AL-N5]NOK82807.1 hypothetical protein [Chloroflexi bacterium AL-W]NOK90663.1 hypothetical protein [Chloroflexi bacterium AL-N15]